MNPHRQHPGITSIDAHDTRANLFAEGRATPPSHCLKTGHVEPASKQRQAPLGDPVRPGCQKGHHVVDILLKIQPKVLFELVPTDALWRE